MSGESCKKKKNSSDSYGFTKFVSPNMATFKPQNVLKRKTGNGCEYMM